jgi:hypothetical protein
VLRLTIAVVLLAAAGAGPAAGDVVERRGAEGALEGEVTIVDDAGVRLRTASGATHFVPWDRVRRVVTDGPDTLVERFGATAEDLWRARSRVERGDAALAEPLFERLFEQYRGATHETALVVAEGLLRCRIARGANAAAVIPALEAGRLRRAGVSTDSYGSLPEMLDEDTGLCPQLAPAWVNSRALQRAARDLADYDAGDDEVVAGLAELYRRCMRRQIGERIVGETPPPGSAMDHPGVDLMILLADCSAPDGEQRTVARQRLRRQLAELPRWSEAWARFALGVSQLRESGVGRQQRGMVNLIHIPARFGAEQPYLAGLSLAWVAEAAEARGDSELADSMRAELARRFPNHPVRATDDPVLILQAEDEQ